MIFLFFWEFLLTFLFQGFGFRFCAVNFFAMWKKTICIVQSANDAEKEVERLLYKSYSFLILQQYEKFI